MSSWLNRFLKRPENRVLVSVDHTFLKNRFNHYAIKHRLTYYEEAFELLTGSEDDEILEDFEFIEKDAIMLYEYVHSRFILTRPGWIKLLQAYKEVDLPPCPRVYCRSRKCLPFGVSDEIGEESLHFYCPGCKDVYNIPDSPYSILDGGFFGGSYLHMFLQAYPDVVPPRDRRVYVPKIFGYRILMDGGVDSSERDVV